MPFEGPQTSKITREQLVDLQRAGLSSREKDPRKLAAHNRRLVLDDKHEELILGKFRIRFKSPAARRAVASHVSTAINPAADIIQALSVVYKGHVTRTFGETGKAAQRRSEAYSQILAESHFQAQAARVQRLASFAGPVLEVPRVRNGEHRKLFVPADRCDVIIDDEDPDTLLAAAWWEWRSATRERVIKVLDEHAEYTYGEDGKQRGPGVPHGVTLDKIPVFPGTAWRYDVPDPWDWWGKDREHGLYEATLECGYLYTKFNWIRKTQDRKQVTLWATQEKIPKGQHFEPEGPILAQVDQGDFIPQFDVHDLEVSPDATFAHIGHVASSQVERRGIPQSSVSFNFGGEGLDSTFALRLNHERLTELRDMQKPFAIRAERSSAWKAIALCRAQGHPLAKKLPQPERAREAFAISFAPLTSVDLPSEERLHVDWETGRGFTTDIHEFQKRHPGLSFEDAKAEYRDRLKIQAEVNEWKTGRDRSGAERKDPPTMRSQAEIDGDTGPEVRDGEIE